MTFRQFVLPLAAFLMSACSNGGAASTTDPRCFDLSTRCSYALVDEAFTHRCVGLLRNEGLTFDCAAVAREVPSLEPAMTWLRAPAGGRLESER